jgi:hypothetical protein
MTTKELIAELESRIARRDAEAAHSHSIKKRLDVQAGWMDAALERVRLLDRMADYIIQVQHNGESPLGHWYCEGCFAKEGEPHHANCFVGALLSAYAALEGGGE